MSHQNTALLLLFGRPAVLPIDLKLSSDVAALPKVDQNADQIIEEHQIHHEMMMEKVKANITAAQARMKEQYDKKHHNPDIFSKGALILKEGYETQEACWWKNGFQVAWSI